jgi:hypothetical protein
MEITFLQHKHRVWSRTETEEERILSERILRVMAVASVFLPRKNSPHYYCQYEGRENRK